MLTHEPQSKKKGVLESLPISAVAQQSEITHWKRGRYRDAISFGAVMGVVDTYSYLRNMRLLESHYGSHDEISNQRKLQKQGSCGGIDRKKFIRRA